MQGKIKVRLYAAETLELDSGVLARLAAQLDAGERERAARFMFEKHRRRFIAAHGFLREVLAGEVGRAPADLRFEIGELGKPRLRDAALHFSLTHTGEHALLAVAERELGLDAESVRPARVDEALARRVMSDNEFEAWCAADREQQVSAFFRLWSAKESVMKACGQGLQLAPESFSVFAPGTLEVAALIPVAGRCWTPRTLASLPGYALALATDAAPEIERIPWS